MTSKPKLSTLKEAAKHFRCSEKTFRKYVFEYNIPHLVLGKSKLFNLTEVEAILKKLAEERSVRPADLFTMKVPKRKLEVEKTNPEEKRYARMLGLIK